MRSLVVIALVGVAIAACGGTEADDPVPTHSAATNVRVRQLSDISKGTYVEGADSYVRFEDPDGSTVVERRLGEPEHGDEAVLVSTTALSLDPGA